MTNREDLYNESKFVYYDKIDGNPIHTNIDEDVRHAATGELILLPEKNTEALINNNGEVKTEFKSDTVLRSFLHFLTVWKKMYWKSACAYFFWADQNLKFVASTEYRGVVKSIRNDFFETFGW